MLLHDVALQRLHVVLAVDRAGLVGADGPTHHGCQDVAYLSQIPGMTVLCPGSFIQLDGMLRAAVSMDGPVAVRYPRGGEGRPLSPWRGESAAVLREGADFTLISYGVLINELLDAAEALAARGISAEVIQYFQIAPLGSHAHRVALGNAHIKEALEDCVSCGGAGQRLAAALAQAGVSPQALVLKNLQDHFAVQGTVPQLRRAEGLDAQAVVEAVCEVVCHG